MNAHPSDSKALPKSISIPNEPYRDQIYQAAKLPNKQEAKKIITQILASAAIDVGNEDCAIRKLAQEGHHEAVNFLRKEFNASIRWMIYGYAYGGHVETVNALLPRESCPNTTPYAVMGYSFSDRLLEVNKLAPTFNKTAAIERLRLRAHCRRGEITEAIKYLQNLPKNHPDLVAALTGFIMDCASYDQESAVIQLLTLPEGVAAVTFKRQAISGYIKGGFIEKARKLVHSGLNQVEKEELDCGMAYGLAYFGHIQAVQDLLNDKSPENYKNRLLRSSILGFAGSGYVAAVNYLVKFFHPVNIYPPEILGQYMDNEHIQAANDFARAQFIHSKEIGVRLKGSFFCNNLWTMRTLTTFDSHFLEPIATSLLEKKLDVTKELPKTRKIKAIMNSQGLNFDQALAWTVPEVRIWLLQAVSQLALAARSKKFPIAISINIATFLTNACTIKETQALGQRLFLTIRQKRILENWTSDLTQPGAERPSNRQRTS